MLKDECGKTQEQANLIVEQALADRDLFGHEFFCQFDKDFRDYFESEGNDFGLISNTVSNVGSGVENVTEGFGYAGKVLKIALPIALIGVAAFYGYKAYKSLK